MDLKTKKILLVNDDGIDAPGLQAFRRALDPICDLLVCAPLSERSGAGCSLSLSDEIAVDRRLEDGRVWGYGVDGTPADCVKFALTALDGYAPDLVLSGINRGRNVGNFIWYSGTVAGALEATLCGVRAMAVSLSIPKKDPRFLFDDAARIAVPLVPWLLAQPWRPRSFWNLNVPDMEFDAIRGVRMTHQGTQFFADAYKFHESRDGLDYYRNKGGGIQQSAEPANSDDLVMLDGYASLSLLSSDLTIEVAAPAAEALENHWNSLVFGSPLPDAAPA